MCLSGVTDRHLRGLRDWHPVLFRGCPGGRPQVWLLHEDHTGDDWSGVGQHRPQYLLECGQYGQLESSLIRKCCRHRLQQ